MTINANNITMRNITINEFFFVECKPPPSTTHIPAWSLRKDVAGTVAVGGRTRGSVPSARCLSTAPGLSGHKGLEDPRSIKIIPNLTDSDTTVLKCAGAVVGEGGGESKVFAG